DALALLHGYAWPGNVRELRNVIERAVLLAQGDHILAEHLPADKLVPATREAPRVSTLRPKIALHGRDPDEPTLVDNPEQARILRVLQQCDYNQTKAAEVLGMSRRTLVSRLASYGWTRPRKRS